MTAGWSGNTLTWQQRLVLRDAAINHELARLANLQSDQVKHHCSDAPLTSPLF